MDTPEISVIITVYNLEKYIEKCIRSVCSQSYKNLQIIVVDDGSTDNSPAICDRLMRKDKRITVVHQKNMGAANAKNTGLELARGDYIGFVDGDDYIENDMYECLVRACLDGNAEIAMCGRNVIDERNCRQKSWFVVDDSKSFSGKDMVGRLLVWDGCDSSTCDKLFARNMWKEISFPDNIFYDDLMVTVVLLSKAKKIIHIPGAKYNYVNRIDSVTHSDFSDKKFDMYFEAKKIRKYVMELFPDLEKKADYFVWKHIDSLVSQAYRSKNINRIQYKELLYIYHSNKPKLNEWIAYSIIKNLKICIKLFLMFCMTNCSGNSVLHS